MTISMDDLTWFLVGFGAVSVPEPEAETKTSKIGAIITGRRKD